MLPFTVIEVEAMTVRRALILALEIGFDRVILEGDSKVFITALQNSSYTLSHFGHIVKNIQYLAFYFLEIYYSHLRRYSFFSKTSNFYFSWSLDQVWIEDVSPDIISILTLKKKKKILGPFGLSLLLLKLKVAEIENWKNCSKIIFKYINSVMGPIFNKKITEKWCLWGP